MAYKKGHIGYWKGKKSFINGKTYEELYGKEESDKLKKRLSDKKKGKHISPSTEFKKGQKMKEENRLKMLGRTPWNKNKKGLQKAWNKGKIFPKERYPNIGLRITRKDIVMPIKDSSIEIKIQKFLKELNIEFYAHQYMEIEHGYQCDILIPSINLVIECDGDYWHNYPFGREIDRVRTKELLEKGYKVLRLWERDIKKMDLISFMEKLENGVY